MSIIGGSDGLNVKNKSGRVKIPDVAKHFDVEVHNLYHMMRQLNRSKRGFLHLL